MRLLLIAGALLAMGCSTGAGNLQNIIGGGEPTIIDCNGIMKGNIGPYAVNIDCANFKARINVK